MKRSIERRENFISISIELCSSAKARDNKRRDYRRNLSPFASRKIDGPITKRDSASTADQMSPNIESSSLVKYKSDLTLFDKKCYGFSPILKKAECNNLKTDYTVSMNCLKKKNSTKFEMKLL